MATKFIKLVTLKEVKALVKPRPSVNKNMSLDTHVFLGCSLETCLDNYGAFQEWEIGLKTRTKYSLYSSYAMHNTMYSYYSLCARGISPLPGSISPFGLSSILKLKISDVMPRNIFMFVWFWEWHMPGIFIAPAFQRAYFQKAHSVLSLLYTFLVNPNPAASVCYFLITNICYLRFCFDFFFNSLLGDFSAGASQYPRSTIKGHQPVFSGVFLGLVLELCDLVYLILFNTTLVLSLHRPFDQILVLRIIFSEILSVQSFINLELMRCLQRGY